MPFAAPKHAKSTSHSILPENKPVREKEGKKPTTPNAMLNVRKKKGAK
jgi:hypothetical protein